MNNLTTAAQQALEALEFSTLDAFMLAPISPGRESTIKAITALRAALAEPMQEPVAWAVYDIKHGGSKTLHWPEQHSPNGDPEQYKAVPLFATPPKRKPLTDEEIDVMSNDFEEGYVFLYRSFARAIERAHGIGGDA